MYPRPVSRNLRSRVSVKTVRAAATAIARFLVFNQFHTAGSRRWRL